MAKLVGQNGGGWTPVAAADLSNNGNEFRFAGGYVATAGTMGTLHFQAGAGTTATLATAYLYLGGAPGATFVLMTAEFSISVGDNTVAIPGALSAATYSLGIQAASGILYTVTNSGSASNVGRQNLVANFPYRNPPGTMPSADVTTGHEFIIWIDGAGVAYTLPASPIAAAAAIAQSAADLQLTAASIPAGTAVVGTALLSVLAGVPQTDPPPYWPLMPGAKGRGRM